MYENSTLISTIAIFYFSQQNAASLSLFKRRNVTLPTIVGSAKSKTTQTTGVWDRAVERKLIKKKRSVPFLSTCLFICFVDKNRKFVDSRAIVLKIDLINSEK